MEGSKAQQNKRIITTFHSYNKNEKPKKIKVTVIETTGNKRQRTYATFAWATVSFLKNLIQKDFTIEPKNQRLFYCNYELNRNNMPLVSYASVEKLTLYLRPQNPKPGDIRILDPFEPDDAVDNLLSEISQGLERYQPRMTSEGTSGTYFLLNRHKEPVSIFKPIDEEAYAPNNPRGFIGKYGTESLKKGVLSGEGGVREAAAYLLDRRRGYFFKVPPTTLVEMNHPYFENAQSTYIEEDQEDNEEKDPSDVPQLTPLASMGKTYDFTELKKQNSKRAGKVKIGPLQQFVKHDDVAGNFGYSVFEVEEVHKIALLDISILNCDRNDENILVRARMDPTTRKKRMELIPIDHGLSLPDCFEICEYELVWMDWPQTKKPFTEKELKLIESMHPVADAKDLINYVTLREECWRNFVLANIVLKYCALRGGLTLYDIGKILYREDEDTTAEINKIIERTEHYLKILEDKKIEGIKAQSEQKNRYAKFHKKNEDIELAEEEKMEKMQMKTPEIRPRAVSFCQNPSEFLSILSSSPEGKTKASYLRDFLHENNLLNNGCTSIVELPGENTQGNTPNQGHDLEKKNSESTGSNHEDANSREEDPIEENFSPTTKTQRHPILKRAISEQDLTKVSDKFDEQLEDKNAKKKKLPTKSMKNEKYYDMFFHYFESFLEKYLLNKFGPPPLKHANTQPAPAPQGINSPTKSEVDLAE